MIGFPYSWLPNPEADRTIFKWFDQYANQHYNCVGIVDYFSETEVAYRWGADARGQGARAEKYVYVFQRKES